MCIFLNNKITKNNLKKKIIFKKKPTVWTATHLQRRIFYFQFFLFGNFIIFQHIVVIS
jgi:capsule polysaccharide export protein KpsE/RkpR